MLGLQNDCFVRKWHLNFHFLLHNCILAYLHTCKVAYFHIANFLMHLNQTWCTWSGWGSALNGKCLNRESLDNIGTCQYSSLLSSRDVPGRQILSSRDVPGRRFVDQGWHCACCAFLGFILKIYRLLKYPVFSENFFMTHVSKPVLTIWFL